MAVGTARESKPLRRPRGVYPRPRELTARITVRVSDETKSVLDGLPDAGQFVRDAILEKMEREHM